MPRRVPVMLMLLCCFAAGAFLGLRYRVLVLLPGSLIASAAAVAVVQDQSFSAVFWATIAAVVVIQVGYLVGAGLRPAYVAGLEKAVISPKHSSHLPSA